MLETYEERLTLIESIATRPPEGSDCAGYEVLITLLTEGENFNHPNNVDYIQSYGRRTVMIDHAPVTGYVMQYSAKLEDYERWFSILPRVIYTKNFGVDSKWEILKMGAI